MGEARADGRGSHRRRGEAEIEIRQLFELDDFAPSEAIDRMRATEKDLSNRT